MHMRRKGFSLIEIMMLIVIISILAVIAIPKFIDMKKEAEEATALGTIGALRSAATIYYARSAINTCLCLASSDPNSCNSYRNTTASAPCYPSGTTELETLLTSPPDWGGICYDAGTGQTVPCP